MGFPGGSVVKNLPANAGDLIPGWGRSPGEGNGKPLQGSSLGNPMDGGVWWAAVHGGIKRVQHDLVTKQQEQRQPPMVCLGHILFIHSSSMEYLGCFYLL